MVDVSQLVKVPARLLAIMTAHLVVLMAVWEAAQMDVLVLVKMGHKYQSVKTAGQAVILVAAAAIGDVMVVMAVQEDAMAVVKELAIMDVVMVAQITV